VTAATPEGHSQVDSPHSRRSGEEDWMRRSRFTGEQIVGIVKEAERTGKAGEIVRRRTVAPNLVDRVFTRRARIRRGASDVTYIWTSEGWPYVAAVLDLLSPQVVRWSIQAAMTSQLGTDAFTMAVWRRGPAASVLHHSDRGSEL